MRKVFIVLLVALLTVLSAFAGGKKESSASGKDSRAEVVVFAAASMTETLTQIKADYERIHPEVEIVLNLDSSGTLKTQIEQGADCDIFISAAQKQMNALAAGGFIDNTSRVNLLENKTSLAVPRGNPRGIESFNQLSEMLKNGTVLFAMGNSDVPVGQYTQKILEYYGIDEKTIQGCLTYGSNVKEVTTQVKASSVDAGCVYATDARSAGLEIVDTATEAMTGGRVVYPAAILSGAKNSKAAAEFFEYLKSDEAMKVFRSVGFVSAL